MAFQDTLNIVERTMVDVYRSSGEKEGLVRCPLEFAILDGENVVPADDILAILWMRRNAGACCIARDEVHNYEISTVFCITPCGWDKDRRPLHFETMVWGRSGQSTRRTYATLEEARRGHASFLHDLGHTGPRITKPRFCEP